jgi:hypothetical protein
LSAIRAAITNRGSGKVMGDNGRAHRGSQRRESCMRTPTGGWRPTKLQQPLLPIPASPPLPIPEQVPASLVLHCLTMQEALVRVRTQGRPGTPTSEDHGFSPQEVSSETCV